MYLDRLEPHLIMISPKGDKFTTNWIGNERSVEKKLGVFNVPGINGSVVQDQNLKAAVYPLTFYFAGPDNDLEASKFFQSAAQVGPWEVYHPVHGKKNLQLSTVTEDVQPVKSGGVTQLTTEWIEVTGDSKETSIDEISSAILGQSIILHKVAKEQIEGIASLPDAESTSAFMEAINDTVAAFDKTLGVITSAVAEVQGQVDSIKRGIDAVLGILPLDVLSLAGQIQTLISTPALIKSDIIGKISSYSNFATRIFNSAVHAPTIGGLSTVSVQELVGVAVINSLSLIAVASDFGSRNTIITALDNNNKLFNSIVNNLDAVQNVFSGELLEYSYFSQSISFHESARTAALCNDYLIKSIYSLATEKRFITYRPENPVIIAMREYSGYGFNDSNIDEFYNINGLTGQETYLIPSGKELVVYL